MAMIKVVEKYDIDIQAQPEKKFNDRETGKQVTIEAQKARRATVVIADYEEFRVPFVLPEHYDSREVKVGSVLHVVCQSLESLRPFPIKNVNRLLSPVK